MWLWRNILPDEFLSFLRAIRPTEGLRYFRFRCKPKRDFRRQISTFDGREQICEDEPNPHLKMTLILLPRSFISISQYSLLIKRNFPTANVLTGMLNWYDTFLLKQYRSFNLKTWRFNFNEFTFCRWQI